MAETTTHGHHVVLPSPVEVYLSWAGTALYWLLWPVGVAIYYLVYGLVVALLFVLNLLYRPIAFLLQPVYHLGRFIVATLAIPFNLLAKFETLYIYLGVAALVGIGGGLLLSLLSGKLCKALRLEPTTGPAPRSAKQYRREKREANTGVDASPASLSNGYLSLSDSARKRTRGRGLLGQTIMEEDSDF